MTQPRHEAVLRQQLERIRLLLADLDVPALSVKQMGHNAIAAFLGELTCAVVTIDEHGSSGPFARPWGVAVFFPEAYESPVTDPAVFSPSKAHHAPVG